MRTFSFLPYSTSFSAPVRQLRSQSPRQRQARGLTSVDLPWITASTSFSRQLCTQEPQPMQAERLMAG